MEELPSILWFYHTTPWEGPGITPFHLVYGGKIVVPTKIGMSSTRVNSCNEDNVEKHSLALNLVKELWDKAATQLRAYK